MKRLLLVLLSVSSALACGRADDRPDTDVLLIGAAALDGSSGFMDLADGMDQTLMPGAQGGFHVFLNIRVDEVDMNYTNTMYIERKARKESTNQLVSQMKQRSAFMRSSEPGYFDTAVPFRMFLCPTPIDIPVRDEMLVVEIKALEEETDVTPKAQGTIRLRPRCPESHREFCERICSG